MSKPGGLGSLARRLPPIRERDAQIARLRAKVKRLRAKVRRLRARNDRLRAARATARQDIVRIAQERIALRDQLVEAKHQLSEARRQVAGPSHIAEWHAARGEWQVMRELDPNDDGILIENKLASYAFAQSHGVPVPRLFDRWESLEQIDPDAVVATGRPAMLKAAVGHSGQAVVPTADRAEVATALKEWRRLLDLGDFPPPLSPPFFTEEFLDPGDQRLVEVKAYAFYGDIAHVMLLVPRSYDDRVNSSVRFLDTTGADMPDISDKFEYDSTIPVPPRFDEVIGHCVTLSAALRRPFARLDFYDVAGRVVLGEITPLPYIHHFQPTYDAALGEHWRRARARLRSDHSHGMDPRLRWGSRSPELVFGDASPWHPAELWKGWHGRG